MAKSQSDSKPKVGGEPIQPDWRGKVYDADTHQWLDAPSSEATPAAAPVTLTPQE